MRLLAWIHSLADRLFHRPRTEDELEEELRAHIQYRADDLERSGLDRAEAERLARLEFGSHEGFKEECRATFAGHFVDTLMRDIRFGLRVLRKSPGFTLVAILTLALAIGANAVVFGVLNGMVLRPLNVPRAESLYGTVYGEGTGWQSYPNYVDLRDRNRTFEELAAFNFAFVGLDWGKEPVAAGGFATSGNYFDVIGIRPYIGRFFHASDEHGPDSAPFIVLSHAYWHAHFQDDRNVVGRTLRLNGHPFTIIGVAPPGFRGTINFISPDFFIPIVNQGQADLENGLNVRATSRGVFEVFGHLKPGVTRAQAAADVNAVGAYLEKIYPTEFPHKTATIELQGVPFRTPAQAFLGGLMLLAGLILLAACANLGSLFAAHAADRAREVALRLALGSSRGRILRQLLTEAVLIAFVGGTVGLLGSIALLGRLSAWQPFPGAGVHIPSEPDAAVYLVALALALISGLLFGIVPVRQVLRSDPYQIVKGGSAAAPGKRLTARDLLLAAQIAICAVLVTSSMVALRGLARSLHAKPGFETGNTMLVSVNLATVGYTGERVPAMQKRMIEALETIPGAEHAGLVNDYPPLVYTAASRANIFRDETADLRQSNAFDRPYRYDVSPGYFEAAGTSLLAGRAFSWHDEKNAPAVGVVNRNLAVRLFGSVAGAIGRHYKLQDGRRVEVVGVVEDGKYLNLTENQQPAMFLPFLQSAARPAYLLVRSHRDPQELAAAMRTKLRALDAGLVLNTTTWDALLKVVLFPARVATISLGVLGMMGAMLSITGIFGMAAYSVSKRLKELGIRIALGARPEEVLGAALGRAFKLLAFGSAAGLLLGLLAAGVLAQIVYQATPRDPVVLIGVVLAMAFVGLLATWIPAQRALSLDPLRLLREE